MEAQQQDHHPTQNAISHEHIQDHDHQANIGATAGVVGINSNTKNMSSGNGNGNGYVCSSRQSSTRWTPTTDQIRILKDLYYNNGIRSPTADQIQRISARLRQYGKIEGKNVFYWFQNHKARERQKKRFTNDHIFIPPPPPPPAAPPLNISFTPIQTSPLPPPHPSNSHHIHNNTQHNHLYPNYLSPAGVSCSSTSCTSPAGVVGQINGSCGNYGSVAMEKSFRDCSISQGETQNCGWVGVDHTNTTTPTYHSFFDRRNPFKQINQETPDDDDHEDQSPAEIETLPLFPMHGDINQDYNGASINGFFKSDQYSSSSAAPGYGFYTGSWFRSSSDATNAAGSRASLELSLNSSYFGWS